MPAKPGLRQRLRNTTCWRRRPRGSASRRSAIRGGLRRRIHHVVRADDEHEVGRLEPRVDLVHLDERVVRHVGLGEQHVHVPRHPARDRMDAEDDVDARARAGSRRARRRRGAPRRPRGHSRARSRPAARSRAGSRRRRPPSCGPAGRTGRRRWRPATCARNAPNTMPATVRPMALAIAIVRIVPLAPTSVPAMSSSTLPSTRPDAATASPVKALSSEITIGTSAPPIGQHEQHAQHQADGEQDVGEERCRR